MEQKDKQHEETNPQLSPIPKNNSPNLVVTPSLSLNSPHHQNNLAEMPVLLVQDLGKKTQESNTKLQQAAQTTSSSNVMLVNAKKRGLPSNASTSTEHTASSSPQIARLRIKNNQLANEVTKLKNELKKEQDTVKKQRATIVKQQTSLQQERNKNSPKNSSSKQSDISNKEFAKRNKELESELDTAKKANSRLSITKR